jgi:hypothetical protein
MLSTMAQPSLNELYGLIDQVQNYPLPLKKLLKLARDTGASKEVLGFYKAFGDQVFDSQDDLAGRTELLENILQDKSDMPPESPVVPLED